SGRRSRFRERGGRRRRAARRSAAAAPGCIASLAGRGRTPPRGPRAHGVDPRAASRAPHLHRVATGLVEPTTPQSEKESAMTRSIVAVMVAASLALSFGMGGADDVAGKVQSVNATERSFTLDDGTEIYLAEGIPAES